MERKIQLFMSLFLFGIAVNVFADYPIVSHRYLADPAVLVHEGRVYLYCSNDDENPPTSNGGYQMTSIVCVSSTDMKNWTDHGIVFQVPRDASWAGLSWAPSVAERNGKFYLYFSNGASGIGVASADSPIGPFTDPIGESLVNSGTPGVLPADNIWIFDPMTFIDDDGQAYMYFGGNGEENMRVIVLDTNMISVEGSATGFFVPNFFEASWMHKYNDTYYFSYSTNTAGGLTIDYMTSDSPTSGFTYQGTVSPQPPSNNNNNHHGIFELNGTWYQVYHNRYVAMQEGIPPVYRRNLCLDTIFHKADGTIQTMVNTRDGLPQLHYVNPFERVEAETMDDESGIYTKKTQYGGMSLTQIEDGDWIKVRGVDFGANGAAAFTASIACEQKYGTTTGGSIEVRIDSVDGALIATVPVSFTGGSDIWNQETVSVEEVTGVHDLYVSFTGPDAENLFNVDYWYFTEKTVTADLIDINAIVDNYKIDTAAGSNTTRIKVYAAFSDGTFMDVTTATTFTFDPENIVSITDSTILGLDYNTVAISAMYNDSTDIVNLIVKDLESEFTVAQVYADSSDITLFVGTSVDVNIYAEYNDGHIEAITDVATIVNSNPDIATLVNGVVAGIAVGEADIQISYQGDLGEEKSATIHVTVTEGTGIWLEAECGTIGSLWNVGNSASASRGEYVSIQSGNNSTDGPPTGESGLLTYSFDVTESGTYTLYARVICPSPNDDSYYIKMDDGSFTTWNGITGSNSWIWAVFGTTYELATGTHTLTIAYREDGAQLDKIYLTNAVVSIGSSLGGDDETCPPVIDNLASQIKEEIQIFPNPMRDELRVFSPNLPAHISLHTLDGREVMSGYTHSQETILNVSNQLPGLYLVKISAQGETVVKKVIKE